MSEFPLKVSFQVPNEEWYPDPDRPEPLLLRRGDYPVFRPNILVQSAELRPGVPLSSIADFLVDQIRPSSRDIEILERTDTSKGAGTGYFQAVTFKIKVGEQVHPMGQIATLQEVLAENVERRWAYWLILTSLRDDLRGLSEDFKQFVASTTFEVPSPRPAE